MRNVRKILMKKINVLVNASTAAETTSAQITEIGTFYLASFIYIELPFTYSFDQSSMVSTIEAINQCNNLQSNFSIFVCIPSSSCRLYLAGAK